MNKLTTIYLIVHPLIVMALAIWFHQKQNSKSAWTGGPISWPKAMWLSYTVQTWFLMSVGLLFLPELSAYWHLCLVFHVASWWIRGPVELVMIYKFLNWSPKYGITHDLFHALGLIILVFLAIQNNGVSQNSDLIAFAFSVVTIVLTFFEVLFAYLFKKIRSHAEMEAHIYYASTEPKWKNVNRITLLAVCIALSHLFWQSYLLLKHL